MNGAIENALFGSPSPSSSPRMNGTIEIENALFGSPSPPSSPSGPSEQGHSSASSSSRRSRDRPPHDASIPNDVSVALEGGESDRGDRTAFASSRGDQVLREPRPDVDESGIATQSIRSEQADASGDAVGANRSMRQPPFRQTTLGPTLPRHPTSPLPLPLLPNLAQAALDRLARSSADGDESMDDFRPLKKRKVTSDTAQGSEEGDEGQVCSICFELWTNSGDHRIASLKCGHLFGMNCIEKWLKEQGAGGKCPQCNAAARRGDVRPVYAKTISVVDTTGRDQALRELEVEKSQRILAQKVETQALIQCQLAKAECERLRKELKLVNEELEFYTKQPTHSTDLTSSSTTTAPHPTSLSPHSRDRIQAHSRYVPVKTLSVSPNGGARVMDYDPALGMLVASKPSSNQLLRGYGLMKYSTLELGQGEYVSVHSGVVRDVSFSPRGDGLVLTAGMDRTCRLTSMNSNATVQTYETPSPVWACAWNADDPNYLYAGLQSGVVCVYDTRNTAHHVTSLHQHHERPRFPVTSLSYVPLCRASSLNVGGLLMGTLNGGVFWERATREESFTAHPLDTLPGRCACLSLDAVSRHCMASFRPSTQFPQSRHLLCQLCNVPAGQPLSCRPIHQFTGGSVYTVLSRSSLFQRPDQDGRMLAAFGDEETKSVQVWDASSTSRLQTLGLPHSPALDITPFSTGDKDFLAVLSETTLSLYQWQ